MRQAHYYQLISAAAHGYSQAMYIPLFQQTMGSFLVQWPGDITLMQRNVLSPAAGMVMLLCTRIVSRHCWDRASCHKPKVCQERSLSTKQYGLFWDSTSACVPTLFFYERGGSTGDTGRLIMSARSLVFHDRSLKQTHDRKILTDKEMLERK